MFSSNADHHLDHSTRFVVDARIGSMGNTSSALADACSVCSNSTPNGYTPVDPTDPNENLTVGADDDPVLPKRKRSLCSRGSTSKTNDDGVDALLYQGARFGSGSDSSNRSAIDAALARAGRRSDVRRPKLAKVQGHRVPPALASILV